jgi:phosphate transport system substrate-binding protein
MRQFRMKATFSALLVASILSVASVAEGNSQDQTPPEPARVEMRGTIRISGAWALYPMVVKWAEEYRKLHPMVRIDVSAGGAGKGIADALAGMTDMGMVSREIRTEEVRQGVSAVPVIRDAVFVAVNARNPVLPTLLKKGIKKETFVDLWILGKPLTWGDVAGTRDSVRVQVYTRSDSCGAGETWAKYLGKAQEDLKGVAVYGDPGVAEAVQRDVAAIGYNNLSYAYDMRSGRPVAGLQIVPIDVNGNATIGPNERLATKQDAIRAVRSGGYPSPPARDLYIVCKGNFKGLSKDFVRWILSDGQRYVEDVGYVKISQSQLKDALKRLDE